VTISHQIQGTLFTVKFPPITTHTWTMIASTAFRTAGRRFATTGSRRVFSATAANAVKNDNVRMALMATAGLSLAVAALQQREVRPSSRSSQ
jgi:hypothetical protein